MNANKPSKLGKPSEQIDSKQLPEASDKPAAAMANNAYVESIIDSTAKFSHDVRPGYNFRSWKYATFKVKFSPDLDAEENEVSPDTGCGVTLGDRAFLLKQIPNLEIMKMAASLPVRGVGNTIVHTNEYALVAIYVHVTLNGAPRIARLTMEVHIIDNLKANMLIGTDTMTPQGMTMDLNNQVITFAKFQGMEAPLNVVTRTQPHSKSTIRSRSPTSEVLYYSY